MSTDRVWKSAKEKHEDLHRFYNASTVASPFPCLVTGSGGDGTQGPDKTDYLYYLIAKCEVGLVGEGENSEAMCLTRVEEGG